MHKKQPPGKKAIAICKKTVPAVLVASLAAMPTGCTSPQRSPDRQNVTQSAPQQNPNQPAGDDLGDAMDIYGCFITTACVEVLGLPDDCHEMTVLRAFRDGYLAKSASGRQAVRHYYRIAPLIVAGIRQSDEPTAECRQIYDTLVRPCVALIEAERPEDAFAHYRNGVAELAQKYGVSMAF